MSSDTSQTRRSFTFSPSYYEVGSKLPPELRREFYTAIVEYGVAGVEPQFENQLMDALFTSVRPFINSSVTYHAKQKANGSKGGRPKTYSKPTLENEETQNNPPQTQIKPTQTQKKRDSNSNSNSNSVSEDKEKINKKEKFSRLDSIGEPEIQAIAAKYHTSPAVVRDNLDNLRNYCRSKGKIYKDYRAALSNFVKSDLNRGVQQPSHRPTASLFGDQNDSRQQQEVSTPPPRRPATNEEIAAQRAAMPAFLRARLEASEKVAKERSDHVQN